MNIFFYRSLSYILLSRNRCSLWVVKTHHRGCWWGRSAWPGCPRACPPRPVTSGRSWWRFGASSPATPPRSQGCCHRSSARWWPVWAAPASFSPSSPPWWRTPGWNCPVLRSWLPHLHCCLLSLCPMTGIGWGPGGCCLAKPSDFQPLEKRWWCWTRQEELLLGLPSEKETLTLSMVDGGSFNSPSSEGRRRWQERWAQHWDRLIWRVLKFADRRKQDLGKGKTEDKTLGIGSEREEGIGGN